MKIAITGRVGSGKSTVAEKMAKALNCKIVDADFVSRAVTAKGGAAMQAIAKSFGEEFILNDGSMNREKMRELIFSNPEKKRLLEDTLSFYIKNGMSSLMEKALEMSEDVVVDIPLLVTSKYWQEKVDFIIVVDVDEQVQFERIKKRNGHSDEVIYKMMSSQPSREEYKAIANYVFDNTSFENLDANIKACFEAIKGER